MTARYKQPHLDECSRDYLVGLAAELEEQKADGKPINQAFLDEVYAAIPTAPAHFVLHEIGR